MKIVKMLIATVALSGALVTTANARDSFSIGINIGGHDYAPHTIRTHRYAPAYYGHYRSAPRVTYYAPHVRYRHYRGHSYSSDHHYGYRGHRDRHHYKRHSNKQHRRHNNRGHGYRNGWR